MARYLLFLILVFAMSVVTSPQAMVIDCARTLAQRSNPTFFVLPLPFSDELLNAVVKNLHPLTRQVGWNETLTTFDTSTQRLLGLAPNTRWMQPAEAELAHRDALKHDLTGFGEQLRRTLAGRRFVDLGCGRPGISYSPRIVAEALGAIAYVGVDIRNAPHLRMDEFSLGNHFSSNFIRQDISAFLSGEAVTDGDVYYLSGIEARDNRAREGALYATFVKQKLQQLMAPGGAVIIGDASPNFQTIPGFTQVLRTDTQRILVRD